MTSQRAERSLGLIDGIYAIALTLLALEFPGDFKNILIEGNIFKRDLFIFIGLYLSSFYLIYDVWSNHKYLSSTTEAEPSKLYDAISASLLATVVLAPAFIQTGFDLFTNNNQSHRDASLQYPIILMALFVLMYFLLVCIDVILRDRKLSSIIISKSTAPLYLSIIFLVYTIPGTVIYPNGPLLFLAISVILVRTIFREKKIASRHRH
jgi:uncharacterized membrane protein